MADKHAETYDVEAGADLSRQLSVQLTAEQFERLYLQPGQFSIQFQSFFFLFWK